MERRLVRAAAEGRELLEIRRLAECDLGEPHHMRVRLVERLPQRRERVIRKPLAQHVGQRPQDGPILARIARRDSVTSEVVTRSLSARCKRGSKKAPLRFISREASSAALFWFSMAIPNSFNHAIELYLNWARPILVTSSRQDNSLWISSRTGWRFTYKNLGTLISKITFRTLGVDVSPHLFRTAAASTAAVKIPELRHLASALLGHADPRMVDEYYKRTTSLDAGNLYADLIQEYMNC
jgi:hypothetical protein